ncbi:leucine--tRNA ligase, partial [Candidatus Pacearchaeota archaeon]|nr:leucine--tRNA ligase [Candidatus Pacearchaeota archaeon]MBD3283466.1 leucine--tRNA ligase [Candidatus Pacearchaeota archaeon]
VLEMFPYPSASGLHMGHAFNYTIGDVYSRFKRMNGFNVLYPMGFDALGLPAENAAIKARSHPKKFTEQAINNYIKQMKELGLGYDWTRLVRTCDEDYYKWNQYFFLRFLEDGLVYRKKAPVNWCPECNTVLANEQVHSGRCWRHKDTDVEIKQLEQWFIKTTKYAEELLEMADKLDWPERIKIMQKNWIGKSHGTDIDFEINNEKWTIFTTRPDTIYGVTFMVISAQHPRLMELVTKEHKKEVQDFLKKVKSVSEKDIEELEKEGAFTGSYATNPVNNEKIPVYVGNFVLADYGSGMVMAVPAHDQRDFEFAKKYKIPIRIVIQPEAYEINADRMSRAYTGDGRLVNSESFNGWDNRDVISEITEYLNKNKKGKPTIQYKLKDWLISRQRYWGTPIPVVYCDKCGIVPVPEKNLPVKLPEKVEFGKGNPLLTSKEFVDVKCPKCNGKAKRETDTMDTFFDSSWYFLRYCDNKNNKKPFDSKKVSYWMPVDQYIGGAEHACMHLIYARFFTKALRDLKMLKFDEPFTRLFNQGMLHGEDGFVMSKSRGNVVLPEEVSKKHGIDTARLFLISVANPDKDVQWSEKGIEGISKFINKIVNYFKKIKFGKSGKRVESKINKVIKEITEDIKNFRYNYAVIKLRNLFDSFESEIRKKDAESFLKLLSVFCPHICEELWEKLGNKGFISLEKWPVADEKKIDLKLEEAEKNFDNTVSDIMNILKIIKEKKGKEPEKVYIYVVPGELEDYNEKVLKKRVGKEVHVYRVNDSKKYDPENKSKKAKPGKPGIYVE